MAAKVYSKGAGNVQVASEATARPSQYGAYRSVPLLQSRIGAAANQRLGMTCQQIGQSPE